MTEQISSTNTGRLATIRRLYFYLVAFISLTAGLSALRGLIEVLVPFWLTGETLLETNSSNFVRDQIARQGGFLIVSTPVFLIHWRYIRGLAEKPRESSAALRKLFMYACMALTLIVAIETLYQLIEGSVELLLGRSLAESALWPNQWLIHLLLAGTHLALFLYFAQQIQSDGDLGTEKGWAGTWRRLFQMIVGLTGLGLLITGAAGVLAFVWQMLLEFFSDITFMSAGVGWWQGSIANSVTNVMVGGLIWRLNLLRWDTLMAVRVESGTKPFPPAEGRTALRRLYLYIATILSAISALVPAAVLLRMGILFLLGAGDSVNVNEISLQLGFLPIGILAWRWHWGQVSAEARHYEDSRESELVRRLYYYSIAATGLVLLWIGLVDLLRALLDFAVIGAASTENNFRTEQIATGISLIAVGAPVRVLHWRTAQHAAGQDGPVGRSERGSWPRRAYLYGIALVGALLILFELAQVIYRLFLWALADPNADPFGIETLDSLVRSGTAAIFWILHIIVIRADSQQADEEEDIVVEEHNRRDELISRIERLDAELADLRAELAALDQDKEDPLGNPAELT